MEKVKPQILKCNYALSEGLLKIREYICWNNCNGYYSLKVSERKGSCGLQETFSAFFWMFFLSPHLSLFSVSCLSLSPFPSPLPHQPLPSLSLPLSFSLCRSVSFYLHTLASLWTLEVSTFCWIRYFCPELILSLRCSQRNSFHSCMVPIRK